MNPDECLCMDDDLAESMAEHQQLLQLLQHKDLSLRFHQATTARQRTVLEAVDASATNLRALCAFRAWSGQAERSAARRRVMHLKTRIAAATLSQGCSVLAATLRQVVNRRLGEAIDGLWLHAATAEAWASAAESPGRLATALPEALAALVVEPGELRGQRTLGDVQEDQVMFATPPLEVDKEDRIMPLGDKRIHLGKAQRRHCRSPASEASTCVPPSAGSPAGMTQASGGWMTGWASCTRLAGSIEAVRLRHLATSLRSLHGACSSKAPAPSWPPMRALHGLPDVPPLPGTVGKAAHQEAGELNILRLEAAVSGAEDELATVSQEVDLLTRRRTQLEAELQKAQQDLAVDQEDRRSRQQALEKQASALTAAEAELAAQLKAEETAHAALASPAAYSPGPHQGLAQDIEAAARSRGELRGRLQAAGAKFAEARLEEEREAARCTELARGLSASQEAQAAAEAGLLKEGRWREAAAPQLRDMLARSDDLKQERSRLEVQRAQARQQLRLQDRRHGDLSKAAERSAQTTEAHEMRARELETRNAEVAAATRERRSNWLSNAESRGAELGAVRQDLVRLRLALHTASQARLAAEARAGRAACGELMTSWDREREFHNKAKAESARRVATVEAMVEAAKAGATPSAASTLPRGAAKSPSAAVGGAGTLSWSVVEAEAEACQRLKEQLASRLSHVRELEGKLEARSAAQAAVSGRSTPARATQGRGVWASPIAGAMQQSPSPSTSPLEELEAYAELVERLRAEIRWERAEREASESALASLRGSYELLLERLGPGQPTATGGSLASGSGGHWGLVGVVPAVHVGVSAPGSGGAGVPRYEPVTVAVQ